jgi:hypothetical protein
LPDLGFVLDDLATQDETDVEARAMSSLAWLSTLFLQHLRGRSADEVPAAIGSWQRLVRAVLRQNGQNALLVLWSYVLQTTEVAPERALARVVRSLRRELEESLMSTAERLKREGHAEGRAEGRVVGHAEMLVRLLERRFGSLTPETRARVLGAAPEALDRWADRLFAANALDEVFR